jgi:GT2 family glycosyltransferase
VSVAVVTIAAGRDGHLRRLLAGLDHQTHRPDEVVVVDLRPTDAAVRRLVASRPAVRYVAFDGDGDGRGPLALAAGRNLAAASTGCEQLVFLDVDCIPAPDLVAAYCAALDAHPGGLACGPVRYLRESWTAGLGEDEQIAAPALTARSDAPSARPRPSRTVVGAQHDLFWSLSFGVAAATWRRVGGFDPEFVGYGAEDTDFAWRARAHGVAIVWLADGVAFHQWHPPTRHDPGRIDEMIANAERFHGRWQRWPMVGWFDELRRQGHVRFDPARNVLGRVDGA